MSVSAAVRDTASSLRSSRWVWGYVGLELVLFVGGWWLDSIGQPNTGLGTHPDVHDAMGAVFGALGLTFGVAGVVILVTVLTHRIRREFTETRPTW